MDSGINGDSTVVNGITKGPTVGETWGLNSGSVRELEWSLISTAVYVLGTHLFMCPLTIITRTGNTNSYRAITYHIILATSPSSIYCTVSLPTSM